MKVCVLFFLLAGQCLFGLQVHLEDQHSGSFYHFVNSLDLEQNYTLLLVDAHSDASCTRDSDRLRRQLRSLKKSPEVRDREWRESGRVQVFDWIEPLLPRPLARVMWVDGVEELERAREQVDRQNTQREDGSFGERWSAFSSVEKALASLAEGEQLVVSIDLDFFTGMETAAARDKLGKIWREILECEDLTAISFAISRPWLESKEEASFLCGEACNLVLNTAGTSMRIEPYAPRAIDLSEQARVLLKEGKRPPKFDFECLSRKTKGLLLRERDRIEVTYGREEWQDLLESWERELGGWWLEVVDHSLYVDERYRVRPEQRAAIRLRNRHGLRPRKVTWFVQKADGTSYNVQPAISLGKSFSNQGAWMGWEDVKIAQSEGAVLAWENWSQNLPQGFGALRLWAEAEVGGEHRRTPVISVRVLRGEGFLAGLSEQFELPYIFGAGSLRQGEWSGAELGWGNDCANFLVWAWRRDGWGLPWCNPKQLRTWLEPLGTLEDGVRIDSEVIARGVVLDMGSHVAALWQDRGKIGWLDEEDLVAHQLGGPPEILKLSELREGRGQVSVRVRPEEKRGTAFQFVGDVCVDGVECSPSLLSFQKISKEGVLVANLECVLTEEKEKEGRYRFSANPDWAPALADAGLKVVSVANNHALDCGPKGLYESVKALRDAGIQVVGAGSTIAQAIKPVRLGKTSFFAVNTINCEEVAVGENLWGVLCLPKDEDRFAYALQSEAAKNQEVVVLVHWGVEFQKEPSLEQRKWARWFVRNGADLIVGTHPHVSQPSDCWRGCQTEFSLGNFIFPYRGSGRVLGYRSRRTEESPFGTGLN